MTKQGQVRAAFIGLHVTLGLVVLVQSLMTVAHALHGPGHGEHHLFQIGLGSVEAIAALLFLWPRTLRMGAGLLTVIFALAFVVHGRDLHLGLLVYAAGAIFVGVYARLTSDRQMGHARSRGN